MKPVLLLIKTTKEYEYYEQKIVYFEYIRRIKQLAASSSYSSFVKVMDSMGEFDGEFGYASTDKRVDNRVTTTEKVGTNAAHPTTEGKMLIADSIFRSLVGVGL